NFNKYKCNCCSNFVLDEEPTGTFEICPICGWEDDKVQTADPDFAGGANKLSLNQARKQYIDSLLPKDKKFLI
ncbi:MAG: CPCC family cysteine-rich protein, partial [Oscillospiraceae bacterium]